MLLQISVENIAHELWRFGEEQTALWILDCTEHELTRVYSVTGWLLVHGPGTPRGSMSFARACAHAAVYVHEGSPRELERRRRRPLPATSPQEWTISSRGALSTTMAEPPEAVGEDAIRFWGRRSDGGASR